MTKVAASDGIVTKTKMLIFLNSCRMYKVMCNVLLYNTFQFNLNKIMIIFNNQASMHNNNQLFLVKYVPVVLIVNTMVNKQ